MPDAPLESAAARPDDLEAPPCPLCGGVDYLALIAHAQDRLSGKPGAFQVQRCAACALVATWPRPSVRRLDFYYHEVYSGAGQSRMQGWQTGWMGRMVARYRLRELRRNVTLDRSCSLLDVGCGYAEFLRLARQQSGCQAQGIDMDPACAAHASQHAGAPCVAGNLQTHDWGGQRFDVITFFESLEHHVDPLAALKQAHALLKPGGHVVVEVPNFDGLWRHVFGTYWMPLLVPQHLFHFTPRTLELALRQAGFAPVAARSMWFPIESTVSLGMLLYAAAASLRPGFRLNWRRPSGMLLALAMLLWWPLVELPGQTILWALGRTGTQWAIGRKP
jgi:SAM-dependent methyltransferase